MTPAERDLNRLVGDLRIHVAELVVELKNVRKGIGELHKEVHGNGRKGIKERLDRVEIWVLVALAGGAGGSGYGLAQLFGA